MTKDQDIIVLSNKDTKLPEVFYSLQGEGPEIGRPSVFIRTSGCNLYCYWCDTPYTWNWEGVKYAHESKTKFKKPDEQSHISSDELFEMVRKYDCRNIVFTGGEPLAQMEQLTRQCRLLGGKAEYVFDIETNATICPNDELDAHISTYVCSPKLENSQVPRNFRIRDNALRWFSQSKKSFFKFVVENEQDIAEIQTLVAEFKINRDRVYLMPRAIDLNELISRQDFIAKLCFEYGFRYSDRLHLRLYGGGRGV